MTANDIRSPRQPSGTAGTFENDRKERGDENTRCIIIQRGRIVERVRISDLLHSISRMLRNYRIAAHRGRVMRLVDSSANVEVMMIAEP